MYLQQAAICCVCCTSVRVSERPSSEAGNEADELLQCVLLSDNGMSAIGRACFVFATVRSGTLAPSDKWHECIVSTRRNAKVACVSTTRLHAHSPADEGPQPGTIMQILRKQWTESRYHESCM